MKRFHVHIAVDDLEVNVRFYSAVFGMQPTVLKEDYAKWMVQDPHVNFAISKRGIKTGIRPSRHPSRFRTRTRRITGSSGLGSKSRVRSKGGDVLLCTVR